MIPTQLNCRQLMNVKVIPKLSLLYTFDLSANKVQFFTII